MSGKQHKGRGNFQPESDWHDQIDVDFFLKRSRARGIQFWGLVVLSVSCFFVAVFLAIVCWPKISSSPPGFDRFVNFCLLIYGDAPVLFMGWFFLRRALVGRLREKGDNLN